MMKLRKYTNNLSEIVSELNMKINELDFIEKMQEVKRNDEDVEIIKNVDECSDELLAIIEQIEKFSAKIDKIVVEGNGDDYDED